MYISEDMSFCKDVSYVSYLLLSYESWLVSEPDC